VLSVERAIPCRNLVAAHDLYELDPEDFVRADALAEEAGLEVIGFYHSHPSGPDRLSQIDRERAWPGYVQLLIVPRIGSRCGFSAWWQATERAEFIPVSLEA
jgi:proteasome lid subunit RPN8/RPN11